MDGMTMNHIVSIDHGSDDDKYIEYIPKRPNRTFPKRT